MSSLLKKIFITILTIGLLSFILVISILWTYSNQLPDYKFLKNYKPPVSSKLYSGSGELVNDYSTEKRIFQSLGTANGPGSAGVSRTPQPIGS